MRAPLLAPFALLLILGSSLGCIVEAAPPMRLPPPRPMAVFSRPPRPPPEDSVVYVRGEVAVPGRYLIVGPAHVTEVIDAAGGLTHLADSHVVLSRRLDDGRLVRWVVSTDDVRAGAILDPPILPDDTIDAVGVH